ncbi:hypothetical protein H8B15_04320 [Hymenobacter sp. BT507]|uniref:DUF5640 domain-containing protein n=1 Tax=Hymenobacter citatus TaxID=2763506 RepID=A0ABR7MGF6_9BACT|nr:hypothetical protein [Hymenobacter citatus]MBC6610131.1 hypothetical protein [Hymenobacter citatus]
MTLRLLPILLIIITSCNTEQNTTPVQDILQPTDTTKEIKNAISRRHNIVEKSDSTTILGIWKDGNSENATFDIRKDSIYYIDQFATYKYFIIGDSIKIYYPDRAFTGLVSLSKDTLTITSEDGATKFWKFKN